jgi:predicted PurR-regulated permease PerM
MQLDIGTKQYIEQIDSLKTLINKTRQEGQDSIKKLNFELKFTSEQTRAANDRAQAVQNAVEKIKTNTTITVKGVEEIKDAFKK